MIGWTELETYQLNMTKLYALATLMALGLLSSCGSGPDEPAPATANLALDLEPVVSTAPLKLNTQAYAKADGQTFRVSQFKYLLSNVQLRKADGSTYAVPDSYYLVDAAAPASQHLVLDKVPVGDYTGLSFVVGVDAAHNNGTFQSGGVNHNNDMYWDWSTEYVFLTMAGTSPQAPYLPRGRQPVRPHRDAALRHPRAAGESRPRAGRAPGRERAGAVRQCTTGQPGEFCRDLLGGKRAPLGARGGRQLRSRHVQRGAYSHQLTGHGAWKRRKQERGPACC